MSRRQIDQAGREIGNQLLQLQAFLQRGDLLLVFSF
jgi:hypothetical protein